MDFLESRINNDFSNSKKLEKASLDKIGIYYFAITALLEIPNYLILSDIEKNTCDVSQQEIQRVIQRYELIKMNFDTISKLLDKQMLQSEKQEKAKAYKNEVETIQGNLQKGIKICGFQKKQIESLENYKVFLLCYAMGYKHFRRVT